MILKKISINNIRSYENQEISFPPGSTVLAGDIGSGKTTILLALEFALFGLQPGQKGSGLLRNGKDEGSVRVEFDIDDHIIIAERGLKRGKSVTQSYAYLTIDNEKQEMSVTELKNKILLLLNYPAEFAKKTNLLYRFTVYTPQEEMKQIILESADTRLDTLRHIFGIDKYKRIKENAELFAVKLRESIRNYEGQIKDLEDLKKKIEEKKKNIILIEDRIVRLKEEVESRKKEKELVEESIKEVEGRIREKERYEREADKTKVMLLSKRELISGIESEISSIFRQIEDYRKIIFNPADILVLEEAIKQKEKELEEKNKLFMEIASRINSLDLKVNELEKSKKDIPKLVNCPTCFQNVPEDYKNNIIRKFDEDIQKSKKEIDALKNEKFSSIKQIQDDRDKQNLLKRQLDELRLLKIKLESVKEKEISLQELENKKKNSEKDMDMLNRQIEILKESASLLKKYDSLYEQRKKELDEARKNEKNKEIELASMQKEKELSLNLIEEINSEIAKKELIKIKLLSISELEYWLSSSFLSIISFTERNIMLKLREEFSKLFNEWFNTLVPETFSVRLDEEFTPIMEQQGFQLDYSFLSGGERTAIALAYRLALNQVINSLLSKIKTHDLVVLD